MKPKLCLCCPCLPFYTCCVLCK